jgi:hypothetical protein
MVVSVESEVFKLPSIDACYQVCNFLKNVCKWLRVFTKVAEQDKYQGIRPVIYDFLYNLYLWLLRQCVENAFGYFFYLNMLICYLKLRFETGGLGVLFPIF